VSLRDDIWRTESASYPSRFLHRILFADVDAFRHLNNGALARFFEEGRVSANARIFSVPSVLALEGHGIVLARLTAEFLREGRYPGEIEVCTSISEVGRSSFTHAQAALQDGVCIALTEAVMVKSIGGKPAALGHGERAVIESLKPSVA
jgi:acyl-CoA thioester hydrolase